MSLFTPTVPRDLHDALQARYDALLEKYHALKLLGQYAPKPGVVHPPRPEPELLAEHRMADDIAGHLEQHLMSIPGVSAHEAKAEADRIRREALSPFGDPPLS